MIRSILLRHTLPRESLVMLLELVLVLVLVLVLELVLVLVLVPEHLP